jgi:hypothetical protein
LFFGGLKVLNAGFKINTGILHFFPKEFEIIFSFKFFQYLQYFKKAGSGLNEFESTVLLLFVNFSKLVLNL